MEWNQLSVRDRAKFIHLFVKGGILTTKEQEEFYNNSINGPGKRQTFNPTKNRYTTSKTVGYNKIPLEGQQLDKYNEMMDQQVDNIMNTTGADYETAFKISGYDHNKYVPIKHNFIKRANGGHLFDGIPGLLSVTGKSGQYNTYLEGQNLGQTAIEKYKVSANNGDFHTYSFNSPYGKQKVYSMPAIDNQPATIYGTDFNYNEKDNPQEYNYYLSWLNSLQNDKTLTQPSYQLPPITITPK